MMSYNVKKLVVLGLSVALVAVVPIATASLPDVVLAIHAEAGRSAGGTILIHQSDGWWDGDTFTWQCDQDMPIMDDAGQLIATLRSATAIQYSDPGHSRSLPQVSLGFAMQAGSLPTSFTVSSALLSFGTLTNPQGRATVGVTVSDSTGDGALLTGTGPGGNSYLAQYNGFVPGGTTFRQAITSVSVDPFDITNANDDSGWQLINGSVNDISTQISFSLSAGDLASGTSLFQLTPEPTSLLLIAALAVVRRRA
jgi:hypothetical protein